MTSAAHTPTIGNPSAMQADDWKNFAYPEPTTPYANGAQGSSMLDVGDGHKLHVQEFGNPKGEPVIVLHGGPGGGCNLKYARYFDPARYRIIMFDQRGCGLSTPTTHIDLEGAMKGNNTAALVEDIEKIRTHLGIKGKMHVEGGSWGSTLALAYAIKHPEHVKSLIMRGVFLGRSQGIEYLFQGNAATYRPIDKPLTDTSTLQETEAFLRHFNEQDASKEGAYRAYMPDQGAGDQIPQEYHAQHPHMIEAYAKAWDRFVRNIPEQERGNMIKAYVQRLEAKADQSKKGSGTYDPTTNTIDPDYQQEVAFSFAQWEGTISKFCHAPEQNGKINLGNLADPEHALDFARLEARYSHDGFYLSEDGSPVVGGSSYLMDNLDKIAQHNIPMAIVHGENDQVCPKRDAVLLAEKYQEALNRCNHPEPANITLDIREASGHSMLEKSNTLGLIEAGKNAPVMTRADYFERPACGETQLTTMAHAVRNAYTNTVPQR